MEKKEKLCYQIGPASPYICSEETCDESISWEECPWGGISSKKDDDLRYQCVKYISNNFSALISEKPTPQMIPAILAYVVTISMRLRTLEDKVNKLCTDS